MNEEYYLVHKDALPEFFPDVLKARIMVETEGNSVSNACKQCKISRSTYYKYKDYIFYPNTVSSRKVIFGFVVDDQQGVLSRIISQISKFECNVLSINQNMPIQKFANITIMLDLTNNDISIEEMVNQLKKIDNVKSVEVLAHE